MGVGETGKNGFNKDFSPYRVTVVQVAAGRWDTSTKTRSQRTVPGTRMQSPRGSSHLENLLPDVGCRREHMRLPRDVE